MKPFDEHEPLAVFANQDGRALSGLQDALGERCHFRGVEGRAALHRHVDTRDRNGFGLQQRSTSRPAIWTALSRTALIIHLLPWSRELNRQLVRAAIAA